jgi:hypothetical protein
MGSKLVRSLEPKKIILADSRIVACKRLDPATRQHLCIGTPISTHFPASASRDESQHNAAPPKACPAKATRAKDHDPGCVGRPQPGRRQHSCCLLSRCARRRRGRSRGSRIPLGRNPCCRLARLKLHLKLGRVITNLLHNADCPPRTDRSLDAIARVEWWRAGCESQDGRYGNVKVTHHDLFFLKHSVSRSDGPRCS